MPDRIRKKRGNVALVFCGGKGTRMQPVTSLIRKEMLPVGPQRKPLLAHIVEHLKLYGIRHIVFLGSQKDGGDVANYFGDGRRFGVKATHHPDPAKCRGTGHALLWAIRKLKLKGQDLLVYYGDMFNAVDLQELLDTHCRKGATATVVVSDHYILPKGVATVTSGGMITGFEEKPRWQGPGKITVGLLCLDVDRLVDACGGLPSTVDQLGKSRYKDVMGDIVKHLVSRHEVASYTTDATWRDIGSFQDYLDVQKESMHENFVKVMGKPRTMSPTEPGLSVFLSYQISKQNQTIVEDLLAPCLSSAGYGVISGAKLNRARRVSGPPSSRAHMLIDTCDVLAAIATPVGKDHKPSTYVIDEVTYAHAKGKTVLLFVEEGTTVPGHWREQFTWTAFEIAKSGALIRDVLELLGKVD
jgi:NDP-sugar pyrophosphorylase family protein